MKKNVPGNIPVFRDTVADMPIHNEPVNEEVKKTLDAKIKRFRDAQKWVKPDRTPFMGHLITWQFTDAGFSTQESSRDYDVKRAAMVHAVTSYKFDHINCIGGGFRNTFLINDSLCGGVATDAMEAPEEEGVESVHNAGEDGVFTAVFENFIKPEDYGSLLENYDRTIWEKALFRRYPAARRYTPKQFADAARTMVDYLNARERIDKELRNVYGEPVEMDVMYNEGTVETLFNTLIGIKGIGVAMRRNHDQLLELCTEMDKRRFEAFKAAAASGPRNECYDVVSATLSVSVMNRKQFREFMEPGQKLMLDYCRDNGLLAYYWSEGSYAHVADFYNEYPRGTVAMMIEQDDAYDMRRRFPNICLQGGLIAEHLGEGTPEQNIEDAKRAINELGAEGGLILAGNKMITYERDLKRENLIAIGDFLETYNG